MSPPVSRAAPSGVGTLKSSRQRTREARNGDGIRGHGGQRRQLPHRTGPPRPRRAVRIREGSQPHSARRTGPGRGMAHRCPARRLRRLLLAARSDRRESPPASVALCCGTPATTTARRLRHPSRMLHPQRTPRRQGSTPQTRGMPKVEVVGLSWENVGESFWNTISQVRCDLAGVYWKLFPLFHALDRKKQAWRLDIAALVRHDLAPTSSATTRRSGITGMETSGTDTRRCRYTRLRFATWADCWLQ